MNTIKTITFILYELVVKQTKQFIHAVIDMFTGITHFLRIYSFPSGKRLNNFSIMIGPYRGKYQTCGSSKNSMISEKRKSFTCADNAKGSTLKITNHGKNKVLSLCEVLVYGTGMF